MIARPRLADVLRTLGRHPRRHLLCRWHWKAAVISATVPLYDRIHRDRIEAPAPVPSSPSSAEFLPDTFAR